MTPLLRNAFLALCLLTMTGCATYGMPRWRHFQGDLSGQGYLPVESGFALSSAWISDAYNLTSSSPVIGIDTDGREVIYFGTADGELVALNSEDGTERWRRPFAVETKTAAIIATPAVSRDGHIYVITHHRRVDGRIRSVLHKVDEFSQIRWSYAIEDNGFATGAPKILQWGEIAVVFVYATIMIDDTPQGALLALRDNGKTVALLDRKTLGRCQWGSERLTAHREDVMKSASALWDLATTFSAKNVSGGIHLPDIFLDPSTAVIADRKLPLIAIADNLCNLGAFEWDEDLSVVWHEFHAFEKHSSTILLPGGKMIFGRQDGTVTALDMETGKQLWSYDAGQPVLATPAAADDAYIFLIAKNHIIVLDQQDGSLVHDAASSRKFRLPGQTYASAAVTENCVYVATSAMLTFSYDLSTRSQDTKFNGNRLASIALGNNGAIYAVAADGTIHKYLGPK